MAEKFKMAPPTTVLYFRVGSCTDISCIFAILEATIFKFWILIEDYIRINGTLGFFDSLSISSKN
jgi:hypothetical protein